MPNFQDTFETRKQSFTTAFSIYMTVPLKPKDDAEEYLVDIYYFFMITTLEGKKLLAEYFAFCKQDHAKNI